MKPLIEFININKSFSGKVVLDDINLKVFKGESLVIIGQSGSGKSVLLKCLLGVLKPNFGKILVKNKNFFIQSRHQKEELLKNFGVSFQGNALFDSLKIWENIAFKLSQTQSLPVKNLKEKVEFSLKSVGLSNSIMCLYPSQISGGMQKRVAIARAIIDEPEILIFDEPTSGLDPVTGSVIDKLITSAVNTIGASAITITHDMASVSRIADKVILIDNKTVSWSGTPKEMITSNNLKIKEFIKTTNPKLFA